MGRTCLKKFKADFDLNQVLPGFFWISQWEKSKPDDPTLKVSSPYLIYRFLFFTFFFAFNVTSISCSSKPKYFFIYLTNWTFFAQLIYAAIYFFYLLYIWWLQRSDKEKIATSTTSLIRTDNKVSLCVKVIWILTNIAHSVPYAVTLMYWIFLFKDEQIDSACDHVKTYSTHLVNSLSMLADGFIIAIPIKISHIIFPLIYSVIYALFSLIHFACGWTNASGKRYIYAILDWGSNPAKAANMMIVGILLQLTCHVILGWGYHILILKLSNRCKGNLEKVNVNDIETGDDTSLSKKSSKAEENF